MLYAQFSLSRVGYRRAYNTVLQVLKREAEERGSDDDDDTIRQLQYVLECIKSLRETWYTSVVDLVTAQLLCRYLVPPIEDVRGNTVHTFIDRELRQTTATLDTPTPMPATAFV